MYIYITKNIQRLIGNITNLIEEPCCSSNLHIGLNNENLKIANTLMTQAPKLIEMYEFKLQSMKEYYFEKMKSLSCRFKSSVERMTQTINQQKSIVLKVRQQQEKARQATKKEFHKSLSRIRDSFNKGKDLLNDDIQELEITIKEVKKNNRNKNMKQHIHQLKEGYESDSSEFDKLLFDASGHININQIKSVLLKGSTPKAGYSTNPRNYYNGRAHV